MVVVNFRQVEETIMSTQNSWLVFTKVLIIRKWVIFQIIRDIIFITIIIMVVFLDNIQIYSLDNNENIEGESQIFINNYHFNPKIWGGGSTSINFH